ncbi:MAG: ABC transporter substrate-binding protein [Gammaproteobacteria bacterium]|nr:ABC transporter substrate-binding protein [Gammaproteobacteria bacterium]
MTIHDLHTKLITGVGLVLLLVVSGCAQQPTDETAEDGPDTESSVVADDDASGIAGTRAEGISDTEVIFGTHTDLTGPIALYGVESVNGINMRFDEINAEGGVHGRTLRLIAEDTQYQVPDSLRAANKLINRDQIFAMLMALGTPNNNAVMPLQFEAGIPNLFPLTGSIQMGEPFHPLKWTARGIYYYEMRTAIKHFVGTVGLERPCIVYIDNDYGQEIYDGAAHQAEEMGVEIVATSSHRSTESEFTATVLKLREANCDLVILGTVVRDTILLFETVRKMAWEGVTFVGNNAAAGQPVASIDSGSSEGYYAFSHMSQVYPEIETNEKRLGWYNRFTELYGAAPDVPAMEAYRNADLIGLVLERVGRDLTRAKFLDGLESLYEYTDPFGYTLTFGPKDHRGVDSSVLVQVQDKRWVQQDLVVSYD